MNHTIIAATPTDLNTVIELFDHAIQYQKENNYVGWKHMDQHFIEADIHRGLLYKVLSGEKLLGIFCVCLADKLIWRDREKGDAIYLHRIVLNRTYAGTKIFSIILPWAVDYARKNSLKFVRMDTWAENTRLINYYKSYGFHFIENYTTEDTQALPAQHRNLKVALLELALN